MAVARCLGFTCDHKPCRLFYRLKKRYDELSGFDFPIGNHGAGDLVDGDVGRKLDAGFLGRALSDFKIHFGVDRSGVFRQAGELGE